MKGATIRRMPLTFEVNRGQAGEDVKFVSKGAGHAFLFRPTDVVMAMAKLPKDTRADARDRALPGKVPAAVLRMHLEGSRPSAKVSADSKVAGYSNYLVGDDPKQWHTDVPTYKSLRYQGVYPGVDLVYYGSQRELEHDFILEPGVKPGVIRMKYDGADKLSINKEGDLLIDTPAGVVQQQKPYSYQEVSGKRKEVGSRFTLLAKNTVGFEVDRYDPTQTLVIDPVLRYSTFVGGGTDDYAFDMALDPDNNVYYTGYTGSFSQTSTTPEPNIPAPGALNPYPTRDPLQNDPDRNTTLGHVVAETAPDNNRTTFAWSRYDAIITKVNNEGTGLIYSTYLGGSGDDYGLGIAIDSSRNMYITGTTQSPDLALQLAIQVRQANRDGFIVKLNAAGNSRFFSTYIGGAGDDVGRSIVVDGTGNVHVAGITTSANFPVFSTSGAPFQPTYGGSTDAFLLSLDASGSAFNYSTYFGGSGNENGLPVLNGAFLGSFDYAPGSAPYTAPVFPGNTNPTNNTVRFGNDATVALAVDSQGNAYLGGGTTSTDLFVSGNAFQPANAGSVDGYVAKFDPNGFAIYSTYLGGTSDDAVRDIAIDLAGNAYVTGYTTGTFPTQSPNGGGVAFDSTNNGGNSDAFVTKLDPNGANLIYSTFLGGNGEDIGNGIAVSSGGQAYVVGSTNSGSGFPLVDATQSVISGARDAFITKYTPSGAQYEYSTFLGGTAFPGASGNDRAMAVKVDANGQAYVVGITHSLNFPVSLFNFQGGQGGPTQDNYTGFPVSDCFVFQPHSPPFAPSNLIATSIGLTTASLAWTDNSDNEAGFEVERKLGPANSGNPFQVLPGSPGTNQVTYADSGLIPSTTYTYRVRPFNRATVGGNLTTFYGPYSNQLTITTLPQAPTAPNGLTVTALDKNRLQISWVDQSNNEGDSNNVGFQLEARQVTAPSTSFALLTTLPPAAGTGSTITYIHTGLTPSTTYEYRVRSVNVAGPSAFAGPAQGTTLPDAPTTAPVLTLGTVTNSSIQINWTYTANDQTGFKIERAPDIAGNPGTWALYQSTIAAGAGPFTFTDAGLPANTTYHYRVRSYNQSGDAITPPNIPLYSNEVAGTTLPNPPPSASNLSSNLVMGSDTDIVLTWTDNSTAPEESGFKIEVSLNNFVTAGTLIMPNEPTHPGTGTVTRTITGLQRNTIYYFRVIAFTSNVGGDSDAPPSNVACTLTKPAAPTNLVADAPNAPTGSTQITLTWTDNNPTNINTPATPSLFRIERAPDVSGSPGTFAQIATNVTGAPGGGTVTYNDMGRASNTRYHYRVQAYNTAVAPCTGGGTSAFLPASGGVSDLTLPAAAGTPSVVEVAPLTHLRVTWVDNSPTPTGHRVQRALDNAFTQSVSTVLTTNPGDPTTFVDTSTLGNLTYYYRVIAFNAEGDAAASGVGSRLSLPGKPLNLQANGAEDPNNSSRIRFTLSWTDGNAAGAPSQHKVEMSTTGMAGPWSQIGTTAAGTTTFTVNSLERGIQYCFRVRGTNATGDGENSDVTCPPVGPTGLTATVLSDSQILLTWEDNSTNPEETGFRIERVIGPSFAQGSGLTTLMPDAPAHPGTGTVSYTDSGLQPNTTYTYRVFALAGNGRSAPSREAGGTTQYTPPSPAANLTVTPVSASELRLDWTHGGANVTKFRIERRLAGQANFTPLTVINDPSKRTFTDSNLDSNTTYEYQVVAVNVNADATPSNTASGLTLPERATGLTATGVTQMRIDLSWTDASDVFTAFKVQRKLASAPSSAYATIDTIAAAAANPVTYSDTTGLSPDTSYSYRVIATNASGDALPSTEATAKTLPNAPTAPNNLVATVQSQTSILLTWSDNSNNETAFKIERKLTGAPVSAFQQIATTGTNQATYTDSSLLADTSYDYRVRAFNAGGDSGYSNVATAKTLPFPPAAPSNLTATLLTGTSVKLDWTDNSDDETAFILEQKVGAGNFVALAPLAPNTVTQTLNNLQPNTTYSYRVKATINGIDSAYSNTVVVTTPPPPPAAPSGLTVTVPAAPLGSSQLVLNWTDNSNNETGFKVERKPGGVGAPGTFTVITTTAPGTTSYTDSTVSPNTTYTYQVRATNAGGDSAASNTAAGTTLPNPPNAPSNLQVAVISQTELKVSWTDNSSDEQSFELERKDGAVGGTGVYTKIATLGAGITMFSDTSRLPSTTYTYRVRAVNAGGPSAYSNEGSGTTLPNPPTAPSNLRAVGASTTSIQLDWNDNSSNETGFSIERATDGVNFSEIGTRGANSTQFTDTGLQPNVTYSYRVRATIGAVVSGPSNVATAVVLPTAPTNLTATAQGQNSIRLDWSQTSTNETGFKILRKPGNPNDPGTFTQVGTVGADVVFFVDSGLTAATTYSYQVVATNAGGDSAPSNTASATTLPVPAGAPSGLTVTALSQTSVRLNWTDNSNSETGFKIERKPGLPGDGGNFTQVGMVGPDVQQFTDSNLTANTTYTYRVRATNAAGDSAPTEASGTTLPNVPNAPINLTAAVFSVSTVGLSWTDNSNNETGFSIRRKAGTGAFEEIGTTGAGVTTFVDSNVTAGTDYTYQVFAVNSGGTSAGSNTVDVNTTASGKIQVAKSVAFGKVRIGQAANRVLTIRNTGRTALRGNVQAVNAPFTILGGGGAFNLAPGARLQVQLQFQPTAAGAATGTLTITSTDPNKPTVNVSLKGSGK